MKTSKNWDEVYELVARKGELKASDIGPIATRMLEDRNRLGAGETGRYAQHSLALGYLLYHFDLDLDDTNCESLLVDALGADDSLQLAHLYLGYHYFDHEQFPGAEIHLQQCDKGYFQHWVGLKIDELLICCHIMTLDLQNPEIRDLIVIEIRSWLAVLVGRPTEDVPMPTEVVRCLGRQRQRLDDSTYGSIAASINRAFEIHSMDFRRFRL